MVNLHREFLQYYENLQIPANKKNEIEESAKIIKKRIEEAIESKGFKVIFREQGSSAMGTRICTKEDKWDLDIGCYIDLKNKSVTGHNLQKWVYKAVRSLNQAASHNRKCIRVTYPEYDIDIPVYIEQKDDVPLLAVNNEKYIKSDSQGLIRWFKEKTKNNKALIRIICYLKAWGSYNEAVEMPPGLAFSILAIENQYIVPNRDDLSLWHTLENILNALEANFQCIVPVEPRDDIFKEYPEKRKDDIMTALRIYVKNAQEACNASTEYQSNELWKKFLGNNYPRFSPSMCPTHSDEANDFLLRMDTEKADFLKKCCSSTLLNYVLPLKNIKNIKGDCIDLDHDFTLESELMENVAKVIYVWMKAGGYILCNGKKIQLKGFSTFFSDSSYQHIIEQWEQSKEQGQIPYYIYD